MSEIQKTMLEIWKPMSKLSIRCQNPQKQCQKLKTSKKDDRTTKNVKTIKRDVKIN